ncbi:MAG: FAD-dependent oxidoreductase [Faecalibacterium sp.]|nr:FAD-dependent oxidoreductase [Ruminococcus sp.]MCM1391308.1 FAD-dependent oxidoreductase [Ruminococcus sp.]MCM1484862.1 FAD-dependent oxidoreductase [Faecalibacterium sp.]
MSSSILAEPMKIGSCEIKNRIVMPPMLMGFGQFDGTPTEKMMDYYEERAKGGAGLIMTEITRVNDQTGSAAFAQLAVSHDYHIEPLREFAKRIHKHGAKFFVQLHHPGRQNVGLLVGTVPLSIKMEKLTKGGYGKILYKLTPAVGPTLLKHDIVPSSVAPSKCAPAYFAGGRVRELRYKEIKQLERQFIDGAIRVQKAGCDGVELHASHGYLLQQFISPVTNKRTDEYGGSLENRMRFIRNILQGIKAECGKDFPVIVRLTADECYAMIGEPGKGYDLSTGIEIAKKLEEYGADAIDVSSAGYDTFNYWLEPVSFEPGWRKYMAKAIKENVSIPVLAANLIRSPEQAEQQINDGIQDFVCLGRPQIADPYWAEKAINGGNIRRCICCLNCIESMQNNAYIGSHGECSVNPFVGHEKEQLKSDGNGRKVVVIGAGPAGLTAANILAQRKFDVTVFEKSGKIGGQLVLASAPPKKDKTAWFIEDIKKDCDNNGVKIVLETEVTEQMIADMKPYAVIVAAGSSPVKPKFSGEYDENSVVTSEDILSGRVQLENKKVALIGSGMTGLETAHLLTENGCKITIIEMADELAPGTWMQHKDDVIPQLEKAGTKFKTQEKLCEIGKGFVKTQNTKTKKFTLINCDCVVLSLGSRPNKNVAEQFAKFNPIIIGDCNKVGKIADATKAAYNAAMRI